MTDLYESKGPFESREDIVLDATGDPIADTYGYAAVAARIAAALNAAAGARLTPSEQAVKAAAICIADPCDKETLEQVRFAVQQAYDIDALNAEDRLKELEAFRALVASMPLEGEQDPDLDRPFDPDHADQHEALEALIRQARNLKGDTTND